MHAAADRPESPEPSCSSWWPLPPSVMQQSKPCRVDVLKHHLSDHQLQDLVNEVESSERYYTLDLSEQSLLICYICKLNMTLAQLKNHVIYEHDHEYKQYKKKYNLTYSKIVHHRCLECGEDVQSEYSYLASHARTHGLTLSDYKAKHFQVAIKQRKKSCQEIESSTIHSENSSSIKLKRSTSQEHPEVNISLTKKRRRLSPEFRKQPSSPSTQSNETPNDYVRGPYRHSLVRADSEHESERVFSKDIRDLCWQQCRMCGDIVLRLYQHVYARHKMSSKAYRSKYGKVEYGVYHQCGVCHVSIAFDLTILSNHINNTHKLGYAAYKDKYLTGHTADGTEEATSPSALADDQEETQTEECTINSMKQEPLEESKKAAIKGKKKEEDPDYSITDDDIDIEENICNIKEEDDSDIEEGEREVDLAKAVLEGNLTNNMLENLKSNEMLQDTSVSEIDKDKETPKITRRSSIELPQEGTFMPQPTADRFREKRKPKFIDRSKESRADVDRPQMGAKLAGSDGGVGRRSQRPKTKPKSLTSDEYELSPLHVVKPKPDPSTTQKKLAVSTMNSPSRPYSQLVLDERKSETLLSEPFLSEESVVHHEEGLGQGAALDPRYNFITKDGEVFSDVLSEQCKFLCAICNVRLIRKRLTKHILKAHKMSYSNYKAVYGEYVPLQEIFYRCKVCGDKLQFSYDIIKDHVRNHKLGFPQYNAKYGAFSDRDNVKNFTNVCENMCSCLCELCDQVLLHHHFGKHLSQKHPGKKIKEYKYINKTYYRCVLCHESPTPATIKCHTGEMLFSKMNIRDHLRANHHGLTFRQYAAIPNAFLGDLSILFRSEQGHINHEDMADFLLDREQNNRKSGTKLVESVVERVSPKPPMQSPPDSWLEGNSFTCLICMSAFPNKEGIKDHAKAAHHFNFKDFGTQYTASDNFYACKICEAEVYHDRETIQTHLVDVHSLSLAEYASEHEKNSRHPQDFDDKTKFADFEGYAAENTLDEVNLSAEIAFADSESGSGKGDGPAGSGGGPVGRDGDSGGNDDKPGPDSPDSDTGMVELNPDLFLSLDGEDGRGYSACATENKHGLTLVKRQKTTAEAQGACQDTPTATRLCEKATSSCAWAHRPFKVHLDDSFEPEEEPTKSLTSPNVAADQQLKADDVNPANGVNVIEEVAHSDGSPAAGEIKGKEVKSQKTYSDDFEERTRIKCLLCGLVGFTEDINVHIIEEHGNEHEGQVEYVSKIWHRCHLCSKEMLFVTKRVESHLASVHNLSIIEYLNQLLLLGSADSPAKADHEANSSLTTNGTLAVDEQVAIDRGSDITVGASGKNDENLKDTKKAGDEVGKKKPLGRILVRKKKGSGLPNSSSSSKPPTLVNNRRKSCSSATGSSTVNVSADQGLSRKRETKDKENVLKNISERVDCVKNGNSHERKPPNQKPLANSTESKVAATEPKDLAQLTEIISSKQPEGSDRPSRRVKRVRSYADMLKESNDSEEEEDFSDGTRHTTPSLLYRPKRVSRVKSYADLHEGNSTDADKHEKIPAGRKSVNLSIESCREIIAMDTLLKCGYCDQAGKKKQLMRHFKDLHTGLPAKIKIAEDKACCSNPGPESGAIPAFSAIKRSGALNSCNPKSSFEKPARNGEQFSSSVENPDSPDIVENISVSGSHVGNTQFRASEQTDLIHSPEPAVEIYSPEHIGEVHSSGFSEDAVSRKPSGHESAGKKSFEPTGKVLRCEPLQGVQHFELDVGIHSSEPNGEVNSQATARENQSPETSEKTHTPEPGGEVHSHEPDGKVLAPEPTGNDHYPKVTVENQFTYPPGKNRIPETAGEVYFPNPAQFHSPEVVGEDHSLEIITENLTFAPVGKVHAPETSENYNSPEPIRHLHFPESVGEVNSPEIAKENLFPGPSGKVRPCEPVQGVHHVELDVGIHSSVSDGEVNSQATAIENQSPEPSGEVHSSELSPETTPVQGNVINIGMMRKKIENNENEMGISECVTPCSGDVAEAKNFQSCDLKSETPDSNNPVAATQADESRLRTENGDAPQLAAYTDDLKLLATESCNMCGQVIGTDLRSTHFRLCHAEGPVETTPVRRFNHRRDHPGVSWKEHKAKYFKKSHEEPPDENDDEVDSSSPVIGLDVSFRVKDLKVNLKKLDIKALDLTALPSEYDVELDKRDTKECIGRIEANETSSQVSSKHVALGKNIEPKEEASDALKVHEKIILDEVGRDCQLPKEEADAEKDFIEETDDENDLIEDSEDEYKPTDSDSDSDSQDTDKESAKKKCGRNTTARFETKKQQLPSTLKASKYSNPQPLEQSEKESVSMLVAQASKDQDCHVEGDYYKAHQENILRAQELHSRGNYLKAHGDGLKAEKPLSQRDHIKTEENTDTFLQVSSVSKPGQQSKDSSALKHDSRARRSKTPAINKYRVFTDDLSLLSAYFCAVCRKTFQCSRAAGTHMKDEHGQKNPVINIHLHECRVCGKDLVFTENEVKRHIGREHSEITWSKYKKIYLVNSQETERTENLESDNKTLSKGFDDITATASRQEPIKNTAKNGSIADDPPPLLSPTGAALGRQQRSRRRRRLSTYILKGEEAEEVDDDTDKPSPMDVVTSRQEDQAGNASQGTGNEVTSQETEDDERKSDWPVVARSAAHAVLSLDTDSDCSSQKFSSEQKKKNNENPESMAMSASFVDRPKRKSTITSYTDLLKEDSEMSDGSDWEPCGEGRDYFTRFLLRSSPRSRSEVVTEGVEGGGNACPPCTPKIIFENRFTTQIPGLFTPRTADTTNSGLLARPCKDDIKPGSPVAVELAEKSQESDDTVLLCPFVADGCTSVLDSTEGVYGKLAIKHCISAHKAPPCRLKRLNLTWKTVERSCLDMKMFSHLSQMSDSG